MNLEKNKVNLISLCDDDVLLKVFQYLNWIDSVQLAATCKRIKNVEYWVKKQNEEFDLIEYVEKATVPIENVLPVIGPYIRAAKINDRVISKSFMEKCNNIKSLNIDECSSRSVAITLNIWMKALKIESLSIGKAVLDIEDLLDGIEGLKTFLFESNEKLPRDFFYKNSAIQHLLLLLGDDYDLSSLLVLHSLQSLFLYTERTGLLDDVRKYVKLDNLKEFSIHFLEDYWDENGWNNFGKYLAKNTKLNNLQLTGCNFFGEEETFSTLKLFNLTSLCLDVDLTWNDFLTVSHVSPEPRLKYLKLQWPFSWCCSEKIGHILKVWTTVEAICLNAPDSMNNHQLQFKDAFFSDILKISDNRPGLRLHIFSSEICFNFISKQYNIIEERKCCSCKDSFQLWDRDRPYCNNC